MVLERMLCSVDAIRGFYRLAERDERLRELARRFRGHAATVFPERLRGSGERDRLQQLSLVVGIHLLNRLAQRYGPTISASPLAQPGFPTPSGWRVPAPEPCANSGSAWRRPAP